MEHQQHAWQCKALEIGPQRAYNTSSSGSQCLSISAAFCFSLGVRCIHKKEPPSTCSFQISLSTRLFPSPHCEHLASSLTCPLFLGEAFQDKNSFFTWFDPSGKQTGTLTPYPFLGHRAQGLPRRFQGFLQSHTQAEEDSSS